MKAGPRKLTFPHFTATSPDERLLRRTKALQLELEKANAIGVVTEDVGKQVFALEIMNPE